MTATTTNPYSIIITDDDPGCRQALQDIVEAEGFRTFLASCGEEALDIMQVESIHLALLDMHMPKLSGLETLQLMHQLNAMLPGILITADATVELMRQAFRAKAYSVIPKPVSKNVVIYTVVRALIRVYGSPTEGDSTP